MRMDDFTSKHCRSNELENKTIEDNRHTRNSSNDTQNDSGVSVVINIDLSDNRQTEEDDEYTRKLYRKFYQANSY